MSLLLAVHTLFVFVVLRHDDARFAEELPELTRAVILFTVLAMAPGDPFA